MAMSEGFAALLSLGAGVALGIVFFGGLWWTIRKLPGARQPVLLVLVSFVGRSGLAVAGFILMARGGWPTLAAGMLGFFLARHLLMQRARSPDPASESTESV